MLNSEQLRMLYTDIFDSDFQVTEAIKEKYINGKYSNCEPRIRTGKFYTDEEKEKYIKQSLNRKLPGTKKKLIYTIFKKNKRSKNEQ